MDLSTASGRRRVLLIVTGLLCSLVLLTLAIPLWGGYIARRDVAKQLNDFPTPPASQAGTVIDPPRLMPDWTLTSHTGQPLHLRDLRGKAVLIFFGYTSCPDVCPTTLADFAQVKRALGSDADRLAVVFVSVDSARDTPERLARYVTSFNPSFVGATSDDATLRLMGKDYGLYFERQPTTGTSAGYLVDHSAASYLLDPQGRERMIYGFNTSPDIVVRDVRAALLP